MKKIIMIIALAVALLMLIGCGAKQKMEDKLAEKIVETALGGNVDIDGEEVTIEGEDGAVTFGAGEWPDSDLAKIIPEFKDGTITSVVNSEGYVFIIMEEVGEDNFKDYLDKVKSKFTEEAYESKFEDTIAYSATNTEGIAMIVSYTISDKVLSIQASIPEKTE
ncbi:MAG: hypothetical protein K0R07_1536 [Sedimentibacter sp.]|jgi:hypothetical protein|nr:hypothetical protein [Sedimentibacter sp.]